MTADLPAKHQLVAVKLVDVFRDCFLLSTGSAYLKSRVGGSLDGSMVKVPSVFNSGQRNVPFLEKKLIDCTIPSWGPVFVPSRSTSSTTFHAPFNASRSFCFWSSSARARGVTHSRPAMIAATQTNALFMRGSPLSVRGGGVHADAAGLPSQERRLSGTGNPAASKIAIESSCANPALPPTTGTTTSGPKSPAACASPFRPLFPSPPARTIPSVLWPAAAPLDLDWLPATPGSVACLLASQAGHTALPARAPANAA